MELSAGGVTHSEDIPLYYIEEDQWVDFARRVKLVRGSSTGSVEFWIRNQGEDWKLMWDATGLETDVDKDREVLIWKCMLDSMEVRMLRIHRRYTSLIRKLEQVVSLSLDHDLIPVLPPNLVPQTRPRNRQEQRELRSGWTRPVGESRRGASKEGQGKRPPHESLWVSHGGSARSASRV